MKQWNALLFAVALTFSLFLPVPMPAASLETVTSEAPMVAPDGKPLRNPNGSYPLLLASMKARQVTEITPANVKQWGDPVLQTIDGKKYWTVTVIYGIQTQFGVFQTEAQARVIDGTVEKWIYTGSGEQVP
jgi:hypothetical protein